MNKCANRIGALLTLWIGSICFLLSFIGLKASNMQPCDSQWEMLASIACLMGIGDAGTNMNDGWWSERWHFVLFLTGSFLLYALVFRTTLSGTRTQLKVHVMTSWNWAFYEWWCTPVLVGQSYSHDPSLGFACQNFYSSAAISAAFFLHSVIS